jgi:hypothetical protein
VVALDDRHDFETLREHSGSQKARNAAADDERTGDVSLICAVDLHATVVQAAAR